MKKLAVVFSILLLSSISLMAQVEKGRFELSLSGTFGSYSTKSEYTSGSYKSSHESDAVNYAVLAFRPGYYIIDGLEFEPAIFMTAVEKNPPSFSISGNLAYNFKIPNSTVVPFVLAGYGIGNAVPVLSNMLMGRSSDKMDIGILNLGLGAKVFVSQNAALRVEYNYQRSSFDEEYTGYYSSKAEYTMNMHKILFGVSLFF
ncbi:MAG: outer membrane beta-barrel protein [Bacteroidota bacterium]|nr:outer membrane beta-barrel protein [Bacteroidota bacterium]MDP4191738.1 outer membrane beta-barrel protein [Bacteroidota bacterium]MDP4193498.1 outer membrane beta-barrel protein [Bacteroidota bacterium]